MADDRVACRICDRRFNPESLVRHERVCQKASSKKPRKIFDSGRQRATGSDIPYNKTMKPAPSHAPSAQQQMPDPRFRDKGRFGVNQPVAMGRGNAMGGKQKSNWRRQHEEFIQAVRAAKAYNRAVQTGGPLPPPPPPSEHPEYVQCPTCMRRFNDTAAARHIPVCAERCKVTPVRKAPDANARMRANARNYVPPAPGKPKSTSGGMRGNIAGPSDYNYDSFQSASSQGTRYGGAQRSGGVGGRTGPGRQIPDDDYDAPIMAPGPRGSRLGGSKTQPGVSGARAGASSGSYGRGGYPGSSAIGGRTGAGQAAYLGSSSTQRSQMNGGYADYNDSPVGGRGGGMGRTAGGYSEPSPSGQFCYECGNQYPSKAAKFCVECGVKRIGF